MQIKVTAPAQIHTTIQLPSSKSISNRALIINALGNRTFQLENLSDCDDTQVMIHALNDGKNTIDIMAAGTAMRFLTAYLSVTPGTRIITGTQRMQQRPIQVLVNALRELGAEIEYIINDGYPPLRITGHKLQKDTISLPGNVSSQYISALLMIAPILSNGLTLTPSSENQTPPPSHSSPPKSPPPPPEAGQPQNDPPLPEAESSSPRPSPKHDYPFPILPLSCHKIKNTKDFSP